MAKIYGLFGAMTGKVADVVMVVRNGVQVARKYQPIVSNPSTPAQVAARAKLKMLSQLAAVMAPVIAIPREGIVSARNRFVKANYPAADYTLNTSSITLSAVQLTDSVVGLPNLVATRQDSSLNVRLAGTAGVSVDRIVYCFFERQANNELRFATSQVVSEPSSDMTFPTTLNVITPGAVMLVLAYGVRDNTDSARAIFGNMTVPTASMIANLIVSRTLTEVDITLTQTRGLVSDPSL